MNEYNKAQEYMSSLLSEPGLELVRLVAGVEYFEFCGLVEVFVHGVVGLDLGGLLLQVVGAVRVDLDLGLPGLGLGDVLLELDADELPLIGLLGDLGGRERLHVLAGGVLEILVALGLDDVGGSFVLEFKLEVEFLLLLRAVVGVIDRQRLLQLMELLEIDGVQFFKALELLIIAAVAADASAMAGLISAGEDVALELGALEPEVDGLSNFPLLLGEEEDGLLDGDLGLARLFGGAGLGGIGLVGVVAGSLIFLFGLGLEEVKGLVHGYQRQDYIIIGGLENDQNDQRSRMVFTLMQSKLAPSAWFSHSSSTFRRYSSLPTSTFNAFQPFSYACFPSYSLNYSNECDPRHKSPCSRQCLSFSFWQMPRKPQSIAFSSLGSSWRASARFFSSSCREDSLSGQQWSSSRLRRRLSYMSQKQGKQEVFDSCPLSVFLKKLQSSSLRFSLKLKASCGASTNFTISTGMASSIFLSSGSSSSSNSTGRHSLTQKEALPQTSQNSARLAIFSQRLKRTHLLLRNFSSKTNLQATNISQATMMLRKEHSLNISPLSPISWSSFRISFLMRLSSPSYLLFRTFSCPKRQRQNSSSSGKRFLRSSQSFSFILAQRKMSLPQRLTSLPSVSFSAYELSVRLFSLCASLQKLRKLSLTMQLMIQYQSQSSP